MKLSVRYIIKKFLKYFLIIILTLSLGIWAGIITTSEYDIPELDFPEISSNVYVYRDEYGVPTIFADNDNDLFFAQGYEYARDRLFQAELFRSIANGELSRLFGVELNGSDKFLRNLRLREAAEDNVARLNDVQKGYLQSYVDGLNKFIELHENNLPLEFQALSIGGTQIKPEKWDITDVLGIQGVMSFDLSFSSFRRELLRQDLAKEFGVNETLEIMPIDNPVAKDYFLSIDTSNLPLVNLNLNGLADFIIDNLESLGFSTGSNNWVVGPGKSATGNPLLANDPHLDLNTPSIWWQVHLVSPNLHLEGFSMPGIPGIVIGHNQDLAWGVTNTGTDSLDVYYFKTDGNKYWHEGQWKDFEVITETIEVKGGEDFTYEILMTDIGPVVDSEMFDTDENITYVIQWTLLEETPNNNLMSAIFGLQKAKTVMEGREALRNWGIPGQNFVLADVQGNFGYQYTGLTPIRKTPGSGILPQNGSSIAFGWNGFVDFDDFLYAFNPSEGYFSTANEKIDTTDNFYITDMFNIGYRGERIRQVLDADDSVTLDEMKALQGDTVNLYARDVLLPYLSMLQLQTFTGENAELLDSAVDILAEWSSPGPEQWQMSRESVGALVFATFRIYLEEQTFRDEMDASAEYDDLYERYHFTAKFPMKELAGTNSTWFDDDGTPQIETGDDIAVRALELSIEFLKDDLGSDIDKWEYGKKHQIVFEHTFGDDSVPFIPFNEGNKPSDGSFATVKASSGEPKWSIDGPEYVQTNGPSMRFVAEIEATWSNVFGIVVPGESANKWNKNRADSVDDWINNVTHKWNFTTEREDPSFIFRSK